MERRAPEASAGPRAGRGWDLTARRDHFGLGENVVHWFSGISRTGALVISLALMLCVSVGDLAAGADVVFTLLYLAPIAFATWTLGARAGFVLSIIAALSSLATDMVTRVVPLAWFIQTWNLAVQMGTFLTLAFAVGALKTRLEAEQQLARTDPLTHVANRRAFLESAALELERARRHLRALTVVYLDCDNFKSVNDELGHSSGDDLLVTIARALRSATRAPDAVARLGGDEFGLLLPETDAPTAEALISRLRATLAAATLEKGWSISFSIGVVTFVTAPRSVDEMIGRADRLMYEAKRAGKDAIRLEVIERPVPPPARAATREGSRG